jgi:tetratricopeptide (TPR) repeat protein
MQYKEFIALREFSKNKSNKNTHALSLANYYYERCEYGPALYFFSCCAENSVDELLSYQCMLMISLCFKEQGDKENSRMNALETAIELYPLRPEAFFLKSRFYLDNEMYDECIECINYAYNKLYYMGPDFRNGRHDQTVLISWPIHYYGHSHFQYIKGLAHYYNGEFEEALKCFDGVKDKVSEDLPATETIHFFQIYKEIGGS